jgi:hypothetical protein
MKNTGIFCAVLAVPVVAIAGVGQDILEREPGEGDDMPDWLSFLVLLFVILMVLGKIK